MEKLTRKAQYRTTKKVLNEMKEAEKNISEWNASWWPTYSKAYSEDLNNFYTGDIKNLEKQYEGTYDLDDIISKNEKIGEPLKRVILAFANDYSKEKYECEFGKVNWDIATNKNQHSFTFNNNGEIDYSKDCKKRPTQIHPTVTDYHANYNVLSSDFNLMLYYINCLVQKCLNLVTVSLNGNILKLSYNNVKISFDLKTGKKSINFNTYKNKHRKVNGTYQFETYGGNDIEAIFYSQGTKIDLTQNCELLEQAIQILFTLLNKEDLEPTCNGISDLFDQTQEHLLNLFSSLEDTIPLNGMSQRLKDCSNSIKQLKGITRNLQK